MTFAVHCDGHANCGVIEAYDEDKNICKGKQKKIISGAAIGFYNIQ